MRNVILAILLLCGPVAYAQSPVPVGTLSAQEAAMQQMEAVTASGTSSITLKPLGAVNTPKDEGPSDSEVGAIIVQMVDAAKAGHWSVFGGFLVLLLIWLFNRMGLKEKIGSKAVPWVSLGVGALLSVALGLSQGAPILDSLKLGLLEGGVAIALWELVAQHFLKKKEA